MLSVAEGRSTTFKVLLQILQTSGFALALAWSSSVGDLAVELTAVRLLLGLQSRVDVVGVIVGFGGVLSGGVELRSGAACLQAERRERLRCCPPTYFDLAFDASGVRLKLLFRSVP